MNKKELLERLANFPDDTEIVIWKWSDETGSHDYLVYECCNNKPEDKQFGIMQAFEVRKNEDI